MWKGSQLGLCSDLCVPYTSRCRLAPLELSQHTWNFLIYLRHTDETIFFFVNTPEMAYFRGLFQAALPESMKSKLPLPPSFSCVTHFIRTNNSLRDSCGMLAVEVFSLPVLLTHSVSEDMHFFIPLLTSLSASSMHIWGWKESKEMALDSETGGWTQRGWMQGRQGGRRWPRSR